MFSKILLIIVYFICYCNHRDLPVLTPAFPTRRSSDLRGCLVQKAGLFELADDDRATLYGALLDCTARFQGDDAGNVLALWKRRGKRAFDAEAEGAGNG